jgi:hypothetical protein
VAPISLKWRGREFEISLVGSLIGEIIPEYYDAIGRKTFRPDLRRRSGLRSTFPPGRYLSQPLNTWCSDFADLRSFLSKCKYVSDKEQFGEEDYWQPPDKFEELKKGDCEDFALWTWRQLIHMNYPARFVMGTASRYGDGHAWITFEKDGKAFLLEPLGSAVGFRLPRLSVIRYKPKFSMAWDGQNISYYTHADRKFDASSVRIGLLVFEWLTFWSYFWLKALPRIIFRLTRKLFRISTSQKQGHSA